MEIAISTNHETTDNLYSQFKLINLYEDKKGVSFKRKINFNKEYNTLNLIYLLLKFNLKYNIFLKSPKLTTPKLKYLKIYYILD